MNTTTRAWKDDDVANRGTPKVPPRDDGDDDEDAVVADVSLARSCEKRDTTRDLFFLLSFFVLLWQIFAVKKHVLLLNSRARKKLKKSKYYLASTHVYIYIITPVAIIGEDSSSFTPFRRYHHLLLCSTYPAIITRFKAKLLPVMRLRVASSSTPRKISREVKVLTKSRARSLYSFSLEVLRKGCQF